MIASVGRAIFPGKMLSTDLSKILEKPPGSDDFPNDTGHDEDRGPLCVLTGISRHLSGSAWKFRDLFTSAQGRVGQLRPSEITCSTNPELQGTTWQDFCRQEGQSITPGYGCRSHADFAALDRALPVQRSITRWGREIIWSGDGNHRVAAMAHFQRNNPTQGFAIDVVIHDYQLNGKHPLLKYQFGLVRQRKGATQSLHDIAELFPGLKAGVEIHQLRGAAHELERRFDRTHLVIFTNPTPLSIHMECFIRKNGLFWDLRRYFGIPKRA